MRVIILLLSIIVLYGCLTKKKLIDNPVTKILNERNIIIRDSILSFIAKYELNVIQNNTEINGICKINYIKDSAVNINIYGPFGIELLFCYLSNEIIEVSSGINDTYYVYPTKNFYYLNSKMDISVDRINAILFASSDTNNLNYINTRTRLTDTIYIGNKIKINYKYDEKYQYKNFLLPNLIIVNYDNDNLKLNLKELNINTEVKIVRKTLNIN